MQKLISGFRRRVSERPGLWLGGGLVAALIVIGGVGLVAANQPPAPTAQLQTGVDYAARWTLPELQQQIEAGQVNRVTVGPAAGGGKLLLAVTASGELIAINVASSIGDAVAALIGLGYGDLLTDQARAVSEARGSAPVAGSDPLRMVTNIAFLVVLGGLVLLLVVRARQGGLLTIGRRESHFATIMPATEAPPADRRFGGRRAPQPSSVAPAPGVRLDDVAGCEEAKLELSEAIEFLRNPDRFRNLGARVPRGILLFGPPGTGKTMLARAVATEAGVPFYRASGSDFVEKYVGMGAKRVRQLFAEARKLGKGVIFIDEFDALAKKRGGANTHEEREQTLNQLLVELDGFATTDDIVVIAATNRIDVLDEAVLRPGRFSRKIHVSLPDVEGRRAILDVHARDKPLDADVDLDQLARKTYGFAGAQLADLLNEAAIMAARRGATTISAVDLHAGWLKVAVGTGRRRSMNERDKAIIAAHEVGHAICGKVYGDTRRVEEISLYAHGEALGVTVSSQEDNDLPSESDLRARLVALMGGRAAEELLFHEVTPGAADDFEKATHIATMMVNRWGMGADPEQAQAGASGRGSLSFLTPRQDSALPSELQPAATRAIAAILDEAYDRARRTLAEQLSILRRIGTYLVEHERIDGDTFEALFEGRLEVIEGDVDWRPATARPREWAAIGQMIVSRDEIAGLAAEPTEGSVDGADALADGAEASADQA